MADRQTKRERKEEARQARMEAQKRAARRRQLQRVWSLVIVAAVVAVVVFLINLGGKDDRELAAAVNTVTKAAGCTEVETPPNEGRQHINPPAKGTYKSLPPTSGPHYNAAGAGPLPTGVSANEVQYEGMLHNLEHGHIVFLYKESVSESVRTTLDEIVSGNNRVAMSAPDSKMPQNVALLAWDKRVTCEGTGSPETMKAAAEKFLATYKNKAPEQVPGIPRA